MEKNELFDGGLVVVVGGGGAFVVDTGVTTMKVNSCDIIASIEEKP